MLCILLVVTVATGGNDPSLHGSGRGEQKKDFREVILFDEKTNDDYDLRKMLTSIK